MTPQQIEHFVKESVAAGIRWERIRLLGGEPTLHPEFQEILGHLLRYRQHFSPTTTIEITTNGYGQKVRAVLRTVSADIRIDNTQKQRDVQPAFATFNVAPKDLKSYSSSDYRNACRISHQCGIGLTPYGYYPCAVAGGIDRILGSDCGRKDLPKDTDGMYDLLEKFCSQCGHFKRTREPNVVVPLMSPTWQKAYERFRQCRPKLSRYSPRKTDSEDTT
jgi:hypothetical protein